MSVTPPPLPLPSYQSPSPERSPIRGVMLAAVWIIWVGATLVGDVMGLLMFAFADSPGAAKAAQMMIAPAMAWCAFTFVVGVVLLIKPRTWRIAAAFVLAASPPFMIFVGYNLFDGASRATSVTPTGPSTAPAITTPHGGFVPKLTTRQQPDFRITIERYTTRPTTDRANR